MELGNKLISWVQAKSIHPIQAKNYIKDSNRFTKDEKERLLWQLKLVERLIK